MNFETYDDFVTRRHVPIYVSRRRSVNPSAQIATEPKADNARHVHFQTSSPITAIQPHVARGRERRQPARPA